MSKITVKQAGEIMSELGLTHLILIGVDADGVQHVATHGKSILQASQAAKMGDDFKRAAGWPPSKPSVPIERICRNCDYFDESVSGSGAHWYYCVFERERAPIRSEKKACGEFVSKY